MVEAVKVMGEGEAYLCEIRKRAVWEMSTYQYVIQICQTV